MKKLLTGMCLWLAGQGLTLAAQVEFRNVRVWDAPDHTRVVFDTSGPVTHTVFALQDPERLVIDVPAAQATDALKTHKQKGGLVTDIRTAHNKQDVLRIVLDLAQATRPRSFTLKPGGQYGHRLVVDLYSNGAASEVAPTKSVADKTSDLRELIIAIDAGHGGEDPGAIGKHGTREKDVVSSHRTTARPAG